MSEIPVDDIDEIIEFLDASIDLISIDQSRNGKKLTSRPKKGMTVTDFASTVLQPVEGFLSHNEFKKTHQWDGERLEAKENIPPFIIGMVVDYLTRFMSTKDKVEAFRISLYGAYIVNELVPAMVLLKKIKGIDKESVRAACRLVEYDTAYRQGPETFVQGHYSVADENTVHNVRVFVRRSLNFFNQQKILETNVVFPGAYSYRVVKGDADFITDKALWEMKVSKYPPHPTVTLQLIVYQILLTRSYHHDHRFYDIAVFNPRLNCTYYYEMKNIGELVYGTIEALMDDEEMITFSDVIIGDEITLVSIIVNTDKRYHSLDKYEIESCIESITKDEIEPDDLCYNVAVVQVTEIVGAFKLGKIVRSTYWGDREQLARNTDHFIWHIGNRCYIEQNHIFRLFDIYGFNTEDVLNRMNKLLTCYSHKLK